jgi:hypothetical protein
MKVEQKIIDRSSWDEINIDGWFKALIPQNWQVDDDEDVIIFDPDGFGELSITLLEKETNRTKRDIASEILAGWADELGQSLEYETAIIKRNTNVLIMSGEFIADEPEGEIGYWRIFAVIGNKIALDVNYNCEVEDRDREERIIEGIIDSIVLFEENTQIEESEPHSEEE